MSAKHNDEPDHRLGEMKIRRFRLALIAGFSAMLILVAIVTLIGLQNIRALQQDSDLIVSNHMAKIELTTTMYTAARQRMLIFHKILIVGDPFLQDEYFMDLRALATKFAVARIAMLEMPLNEDEKQLLKEQGKLTGKALPSQGEINDLLSQNRIREAQGILINKAIPAQDRVLEKLDELYQYQKTAAQSAAADGRERQSTAIQLMLVVASAALGLGVFIAVFVVRRASYETTQREVQLAKINHMNDDLKKIASEKAAAQQKAEQANIAKSTFLANMSHEIRTPLTSIIGFSESLIEDDLSPGERDDVAYTILDSSRHLLGVINDVLDLSKVEADKLDIEMIPVSPEEILNDVVNMAKLHAEAKSITFNMDCVSPLPAKVLTDPLRVKQILFNIVNNAIKFTYQGGVMLRVHYLSKEAKFRFEISDSGIGMTRKQQKKLFRPFAQADASTTRKFGGTGLGLHISSKLLDALGGNIQVDSEINKGSCFTVSLPAEIVEASSTKSQLSEYADEFTGHQIAGHVLVAEDVEMNQKLISMYLKRLGANVETAENGLVAFDKAMEKSYDLILMDMQMPVMDGFEAVQTLRERGYNKPIVALTANAMKHDRQKYIEMGCDDYLPKPIDRQAFGDTVSRYLKQVGVQQSDNLASDETIFIHPKLAGFIQTFISQFPEIISTFRDAEQSNQQDLLALEAHKLKGLGASFGFPRISELAEQMETVLEQGTDDFSVLIDELQKVFEEIKSCA